jgi:transmembrane 9 superfamily protein 2/4
MLCAILKLLNPLQKGQILTALIILYVLCGSVAGYVSARIYKFTDQTKWKLNIILTAVGLPGCLVSVFTVLNIFLSFAGAATAVSFLTMIALFLLWVCVSAWSYSVHQVPHRRIVARVVPDLVSVSLSATI